MRPGGTARVECLVLAVTGREPSTPGTVRAHNSRVRTVEQAHPSVLERVAWPVAATSALLTLVALVLGARNAALLGSADALFLADVWLGLVLPSLGAYLVRVAHSPRMGGILMAAALLSVTDVAGQYATYATVVQPSPGPARDVAAWLAAWTWTTYLLVPTLVPLLSPDGRPLSPRWGHLARAVVGAVAVITVVSALAPGPLDGFGRVANPWAVESAPWLVSLTRGLTAGVVVVLVPVCVAGAVVRWWRTRPDERWAAGWFAGSSVVMLLGLVGGGDLAYPWSDTVTAAALTLPPIVLAVTSQSYAVTRGLRESREILVLAREEERRRLHRDLHDGLGGELAGVALMAGAAGRATTDPVVRDQLAAIQDRLQTMTRGVRAIVDDLRPPALEELGLEESLRQQVQTFSASGPIEVTFTVRAPLPQDLPAATQVAAYRILTESLANVARHAEAQRCEVRLGLDASDLCIEVEDDGIGPPTVPMAGSGLGSMRARAEELGGRFSFVGAGQGGSLMRVQLPRRR